MKLKSLKHLGFLSAAKLALAYSIIIFLTISTLGYFQYRSELKNQIESEILSLSRSFSQTTITQNYHLLLKQIQTRTNLQELIFFSGNCSLIASTTLNTFNICDQSSDFIDVQSDINNVPIKIYFNLKGGFFQFLRKNIYQLVGLALIFFLLTSVLLFHFMHSCFLKPISNLRSSLNDNGFTVPNELNFFSNKILELKNEIQISEREKLHFKVARQVLHDIRNPLEFLKQLSEQSNIREQVHEKVGEIEFHISSLVKNKRQQSYIMKTGRFMADLQFEANTAFKLNFAIINKSCQTLDSILHPIELRNIILNMCRNSHEAFATQIKLDFSVENDFLRLSISDNGTGVNIENANSIFNENFTSKKFGNGIGLYSSRQKLESIGGNISLLESSEAGTCFEISIPAKRISNELVLIDNDKFIHAKWKNNAVNSGVKIHSYFSVEDFLRDCPKDNSIPVYVDSDLGTGVPGEVSSKKIADLGFHNIILATNYHDIDLKEYPWIKQSSGKSGPLFSF